jgi:hypothetical protein
MAVAIGGALGSLARHWRVAVWLGYLIDAIRPT